MRKLIAILAFALLPIGAAHAQPFCPGVAPWVFADVQASDSFCTYITWMAVTGVTTGCQVIDANNRLYCPDDLVTRKQMSAFMSRLGRDVTFAEGGNAFGTLPNNTAVLGTADGNALDVRVNNSRVMRYEPNSISPNVIGGSPANNVTAGVRGATIAGGGVPTGDTDPNFTDEAPNRVTDAYGTVGGGYGNRAGDDAGTGLDREFATVGGGFRNTASGQWSTVGGGDQNTASGERSTVGGGFNNESSGDFSTVGGGLASGAYGYSSTVGGGYNNTAGGDYSWAGGRRARTQTADLTAIPHHGAFVWADSSDLDFRSTANDQFSARATGGVRFVTAIDGFGTPTWTCGVSAGSGGSWGCTSDRNQKTAFTPMDGEAVLARLADMPVYRWVAKDDDRKTPHAGPTAQDFMVAFGLGENDKMIGFADAQGVLFSAVQGLNAKLEARIAAKDAEIAALKREMADLRLAVEVLIAQTSPERRAAQGR